MTDLEDFRLTAVWILAMGGGYHLRMTWRQHLAEAKEAGNAVRVAEAEARLQIIDEIEDNRK